MSFTYRMKRFAFPAAKSQLSIPPAVRMVSTLFNTVSGSIHIEDYTFSGHNVAIITGTHHYQLLISERTNCFCTEGRDVVIGDGVWIGSGAIVLGPCRIGDHALVATGSVVLPKTEIPSLSIVGGVPARLLKRISLAD